MEWNNSDEKVDEGEAVSEESSDDGHGSRCSCLGCGGRKRHKGAMMHLLVLFLIVALVLWIVGYLGISFRPFAAGGGSDEWKAVFLSNGQVYFGKVRNEQADPLVLTDIYYLQVQQQLQPVDPSVAGQQQQQLSLIKFGNELHGPQDQMRIVRRNILYIESLKDSGRVVDAIDRYLVEQAGEEVEE